MEYHRNARPPQEQVRFANANYCDTHQRIFFNYCKKCTGSPDNMKRGDIILANVKTYLSQNPYASWPEVFENIDNHYKNPGSLWSACRNRGFTHERPVKKFETKIEIVEEAHRLRKNKSRKAEIVSQKVVVARALREAGATLKEIGGALGTDHTTIVHYIHHYRDKP